MHSMPFGLHLLPSGLHQLDCTSQCVALLQKHCLKPFPNTLATDAD